MIQRDCSAVNLLLDQEQDREYARSLRILAKECELPEYIITVRHECSHREIPDLNTLRLAAFDAINYVYNKYWWVHLATFSHTVSQVGTTQEHNVQVEQPRIRCTVYVGVVTVLLQLGTHQVAIGCCRPLCVVDCISQRKLSVSCSSVQA